MPLLDRNESMLSRSIRQPRLRLDDMIQYITLFLLIMIIWAIGWAIFGPVNAGLESPMFRLIFLFIGGKVLGSLVNILRIPAMLGMLGFGVLLNNLDFFHLPPIYVRFVAILRELALINILVPAGMGLDPATLRKSGGMVFMLAIIPPLVEVFTMGLVSHFIMGLPWIWSILLGTLMGAVSPAVIIPCLFELQERGFGVEKGIHTLIIASTTLDDIVCITGFAVLMGIIFSQGSSVITQIMGGPIAIITGITYGFIYGLVAQYLPSDLDEHVVTLRTLVIATGSVLANVGGHAVGYEGAGSLGVILLAYIAALGWRRLGWGRFYNPVRYNFGILWKFFEPIMYTLIGIEVNFKVLSGSVVLWGSLSMIIALLARMLTCAVIMIRSQLNAKEIIFVALCNIPKATVQAVLGPVALDVARTQGDPSGPQTEYASALLIVSVMSIVITSPLGALVIMQCGPKLLNFTPPRLQDVSTHTLVEDEDIDFTL